MNPSYANYALIGLATAVCGLIVWVALLQVRLSRTCKEYSRVMTGTDGHNLEQALADYLQQVEAVLETVSDLESRTRQTERTAQHSMQWLGLIRYNPFRDTGGAQSFALALTDGRGDGIVISSLHTRENTRVYAKPLHNWESAYTLTDEEKQAIERAHPQPG